MKRLNKFSCGVLVLCSVVLILAYHRAEQYYCTYAIQPDREKLELFSRDKAQLNWTPARVTNSPQKSAACVNPNAIVTWRGTGLVTSLYPPVEANCHQLQAGNSKESDRVLAALKHWNKSMSDQLFSQKFMNCSLQKLKCGSHTKLV